MEYKMLTHSPSIVTSGLVLYLDAANSRSYPGSGTSWFDLSGNGNNGTLTNGPTFNSGNGGSIVFDGVNDYILLPNGLLSGTGNFTVNQFISNASGDGGTIFGNYSAGNLQMFFGTRFIGMWLNNSTTYLGVDPWNVTLPEYTTAPVMITALRSGTVTRFYINGILKKTGASSDTIGSASAQFRIGTNTVNTEQYTGRIHITQVYNRTLSDVEIQQNFNATRGRFGI